jgi:hypothetical protein
VPERVDRVERRRAPCRAIAEHDGDQATEAGKHHRFDQELHQHFVADRTDRPQLASAPTLKVE